MGTHEPCAARRLGMHAMAEHDDAETACDRLMTLFEYALAVDAQRRPEADDRIREPLIRYVMALLRLRVRPALGSGWLTADPVHVAFFGGTSSGKSTVVNVCLGRVAAGMHGHGTLQSAPRGVSPRGPRRPVAGRLSGAFCWCACRGGSSWGGSSRAGDICQLLQGTAFLRQRC
jgi:hypothetical protein